jgi:hypothetical protein
MKKKLVWMVGCIGVSTLAVAGTANARVVDKNKVKGTMAAVVCSQMQAITCDFGAEGSIQRDIFISGEEFVTRSETFPDTATNNLFATVVTSNSCTQTTSGSFGSVPNSSTQSLQSAHLQGVVALNDFDTGLPTGSSLAVDVNMTGIGDIVKDRSKLKFDFENPEGITTVVTIHLKGDTRSASVSGSLSLDGSPLTCAFSGGTLMHINNGDKLLEHP